MLLWSHSCSEETEQAIEAVAAAFPDHRIDVFAAAETHELDGWERPGLIRRPAESFRDRLALARWALARYDAIVREERRSRLAFERLFPWAVWFSLAGDVGAARNKRWHAWAALAARPAILAASAALAALALLKPRARVDYFTWRGARTPRR
ncbi:MAG: hypothetical protein BWZ10_01383 [candidate division BRC1 bacterium ADurb.BinA364]|nr:MAG: hypothetical protein BWZ10_01383 [candidate division BRC1 bacterium ADurb.BinA364]